MLYVFYFTTRYWLCRIWRVFDNLLSSMPFTIESPTTSTVFFYLFVFCVSILAIIFIFVINYFCWLWDNINIISDFQINKQITLIALRFVKAWCSLLRISANWFSKFIFLCFFEKHSCILFLNCWSIISLLGATPTMLFLRWLLIFNLSGSTSSLSFGVYDGFLVGVSKLLHTVKRFRC